jgi:NAD(P)-dependent dehydrogenase (short-subunit alcohol dehydrogenase family)
MTMQGKRVLLTGATSGIGRATALGLAELGAELLLVARDADKGKQTVDEIRARGAKQPIEVLLADLSLLAEVRKVAEAVRARTDRLDVLLNNAGAWFSTRTVTSEGFERTFALNHLSYFLLTNLLLDIVKAAPAGRIVNVASEAHRRGHIDFEDLNSEKSYSLLGAYGVSKLENILFTSALARRLEGTRVTANALHPGVVASGFGMNNRGFVRLGTRLAQLFMISPEKGAQTSIYLASSPEVEGVSGKYFDKRKERWPSRAAQDEVTQERLWRVSAELVGLAA